MLKELAYFLENTNIFPNKEDHVLTGKWQKVTGPGSRAVSLRRFHPNQDLNHKKEAAMERSGEGHSRKKEPQ